MNTDKMPPIHPGEVLREDYMSPLGLSQSRLAMDLRIPLQRLHAVLKGKRAVSLDTALRLARYFGTSAEVWLNLQSRYDLEKAEDDALPERIAREVRPAAARAG